MSGFFRFIFLLFLLQSWLITINSISAQIPTNNLKLWLKADSVELVSGLVSQWYDASGNNLHLTQSNEVNRPIQTSNIYAGHPSIRFDGTNDQLKVSFSELMNQPVTYFVVWKRNIPKAQNILDGVDELNRVTLGQPYSNLEFFAINAKGSAYLGLYYTKPETSNLTVSSIILSSPTIFFDNGVLKISGDAGNMGINGLTVGAAYNNSRFFNGDITEIIIYDTNLTDTQRQQVEQYLMDKYAPPISLGEDITVDYGFCPITLQVNEGYSDIEWSTGDSTEQITVNQSGEYWVTATDFFGRITSDTINVNFFEPLLPTDIVFCYGSQETVEVNVTGDYSVVWSANDTANSISISEPGTYWVKVIDTLGCFIQKEFDAYVDMFPDTATLGDDKTLCNGNRIVLENGAEEAVTYLWSDGSSLPWFIVDNHTQASVTVTNINGCIAYDTVQINILGNAPNIAFDHTPICKGNNFVFNSLSQTNDSSSIDTCFWIFNQTDTIIGNEAVYIYPEVGNLPVYLHVTTTAGCYKDTSFYATVNHIPNVSFVPNSACERNDVLFQSTSTIDDGEITEWHWDVNGTQYYTSGFYHSFDSAGNFSVSLITISDKGCPDSIESMFNVKNSPIADFTFGKGCEGEPVAFFNQSSSWLGTSVDYIWYFDSLSQSTLINPEHLFNGTGKFPVKLVATQQVNHCRDTIVKTVLVSGKPTSLPNDVEVCAKDIVTLTDNSLPGEDENIISKVWGISQPVGNIEELFLYTFDTSGVFSLTLTVENSAGCTDIKQSQLTIYETPDAIISTLLDTVYIPTTAMLFAEDPSITHFYRWYIDNVFLSDNASITHQINSEGAYNFGLAVETNKGCNDSTNRVLTALVPSVDLEVKSLSAVIYDGKILIRPVFRNNGTSPLLQFVINVRFDNGTSFSEIFESTLYPGNESGYTLHTRMNTPERGTPIYVCLDAVTIQLDQNPDNNYKCYVFDDNIHIFPPSPNPAKNEIKFTVISDTESSCEISIISSNGALLWKDTRSITSGVNDIVIPTPASTLDINYMKVKVNSTQQVFKIIVRK